MTVRRVLRGAGKALLALGLLVLLFVGYEFWGTGLGTALHQRALRQQFEKELRVARAAVPATVLPPRATSGTTTIPPTRGVEPPAAAVADGQPVGVIQIPAIGVDYVVVQGTDATDLELGPGHYLGTPMPGNLGNAGIAGHRTTYLHPFYDLNLVVPGDPVFVTTPQGRFRYDVTRLLVVAPTDVAVLAPTPTSTLTLTTCNPRYSAATRLVVQASLVSPAVPPAPGRSGRAGQAGRTTGRAPPPPATSDAGLAGGTGRWHAALWWGGACAAFALLVRILHRRLRSRWVYAVGAVGMLVLLFAFFGAVGPLLPAGY